MDDNAITNQDLYNLIQGIAEQNRQLQEQNKRTRVEIKEEIRSIRSDLLEEINTLKQENKLLKESNNQLQEKVERIEKKIKKFNLIFYGLSEQPTVIADIQNVLDIVNNTLKVDCRFGGIRDIYRFGQLNENKHRPLLIEFVSYSLKSDILKNSKELKGTGIFISNDYTKEEYQNQKLLRENLKLARENNREATIRKNLLYVEGEEFSGKQLRDGNVLQLLGNKGKDHPENLTPREEPLGEKDPRLCIPADPIQTVSTSRKRKPEGAEVEHLIKRTTRSNIKK